MEPAITGRLATELLLLILKAFLLMQVLFKIKKKHQNVGVYTTTHFAVIK